MTRHRPTGWNTWDYNGFNRLVLLERGRLRIAVEYGIWDEDYRPPDEVKNRGGVHRHFRWSDVTRLGPHAPLGLPARLEFRAGGVPYRAEALDQGGTLALTLTPLGPTKQRIVFLLVAPLGEAIEVRGDGPPASAAFAGCRLALDGADWPRDYFLNLDEPYALGAPGQPATLRVTPPGATPGNTPAASATPAAHPELAGSGALADAPEAMLAAVTWNTLFDTRRKLVSSPVSRDWCRDWKGVIVFCWDTFLVGAFVSYAAPELARLNFEAVCAAIDELGHVPNYYMAHGAASLDRSMPPLGAYLIRKTQAAAPDRAWLRRLYGPLCRWHEYWFRHRDGNGDGLLEWGSDPQPAYEFPQLRQDNPSLQHAAKCAMYESGLDNSPMYDDVPFSPQHHTLELADVGLNSFYAMDCEALAWLAGLLGRRRDAARYRAEYETMARRINDQLWDDEHGIYANRHWDGRFSARWSPTSFFPLIAGVAPPERARRLVHEHLLNEREFWGPYVLPSIARCDPAYPDNDYWRGRIWGPFNFLVAEGLRRYRFDEVAAELAARGLAMFMRNWREDGGVYENYNAETGRGGDVWNAARLYHWGGLLAFVAMQELIDVEPAGWLRFGSLAAAPAGLRGVCLGRAAFEVELDAGLNVQRDGRPYLECTGRAIVRIPLALAPDQAIEIAAAGPGRLTWFAAPRPPPPALVNGTRQVVPTGSPPVYQWA